MRKCKVLNLLVTILFLFIFTSCTVTNKEFYIKLKGNIVYWDEVENAEMYGIYANGEELGTTTELEYSLANLDEGEYTITAKYFIGDTVTESVNEIKYKGKANDLNLSTPYISLVGNRLKWEKIENADSYEIYINNEEATKVTETYYTLEQAYDGATIKIRAVRTYNDLLIYSDFSNEVVYIYSKTSENNVTVFSINDTHGAFETDENTNGIAKVGTIIKNLEKDNTIVKIANGDIFQGGYVSNVTFGKCFIDVLNNLKFDCFVIGNHEFDWGLEKIEAYKDGNLENGEADFPFLAANIIDKRTNKRPTWLDEYTIIERDNQKVGVIGLIGEGLTSSISTSKVENYEFSDPLPIIKRLVPELRNNGCDFVVVSIHEYNDYTNNQISYLDEKMLPDAIICGHTHQKISETLTTKTNYDLPVLQSNTKNITVGSVTLSKTNGVLNNAIINHYYPINFDDDKTVLEIVNAYQDLINEGNEIIGFTPTELSRDALGVFACDAIKAGTRADLAIMNTGGVRTTINAGNIKMKDIYEVFPFDNYIYIVDISGSKLKSLISRQGGYLYWDSDFDYENINTSKAYKLAIIDYVYFGGYYDSYFEPRDGISTGEIIRKYIIDELKKTL